jgi:pilus assembly protein Flp/PilA
MTVRRRDLTASLIKKKDQDSMNYFVANIVNRLRRLAAETRGQDLIEYALMAGFVAVAAGAIMPNVASSISTIFSQVSSVLTTASSQS